MKARPARRREPGWPAIAIVAVTVGVLIAGCDRAAGPGVDTATRPVAQEQDLRHSAQAESAKGKGKNGMLTDEAQKKLLGIARDTVAAAVSGEPPPTEAVDDPALQGKQGCFVTLKTYGRLRGCMGRFISEDPLYETVREVAVMSAVEDPRFAANRLKPADLDELDVEVSVLSPLEKIDDPLKIELGVHGIYIRQGYQAGCFLPQVATETGWDKQTFLSQCCAGKAGLPPDAWKDPRTEVLVFTAEILQEER